MVDRLFSCCVGWRRVSMGAALAGLLTLAGCGYKGPLYMPPPPDPDLALTTPPSTPISNTDASNTDAD